MLAMRHVDLKEAMARVLRFARRLWDNKMVFAPPPELVKPRIIAALMRW